ncbi:MAG: hypothetical protein JO272_10750 [Pseudonocardiales bacterium]|nr:hypothetical protein [Pseudonocardiales bacterium]
MAGAWRSALRWVAIAAAFINLDIHLVLTSDHLTEKLYIGVLFVIGSALLGLVVIGLASDRDRLRTAAWIGGSVICAVEFILFVLSRSTGLPGGYLEDWLGATEDLLGLACLFVELVFLGCAAACLTTTAGRPQAAWVPLHDRSAPLP